MVNIYVKDKGKFILHKVRVIDDEIQQEIELLLRAGISPNRITLCNHSEINPRIMEIITE